MRTWSENAKAIQKDREHLKSRRSDYETSRHSQGSEHIRSKFYASKAMRDFEAVAPVLDKLVKGESLRTLGVTSSQKVLLLLLGYQNSLQKNLPTEAILTLYSTFLLRGGERLDVLTVLAESHDPKISSIQSSKDFWDEIERAKPFVAKQMTSERRVEDASSHDIYQSVEIAYQSYEETFENFEIQSRTLTRDPEFIWKWVKQFAAVSLSLALAIGALIATVAFTGPLAVVFLAIAYGQVAYQTVNLITLVNDLREFHETGESDFDSSISDKYPALGFAIESMGMISAFSGTKIAKWIGSGVMKSMNQVARYRWMRLQYSKFCLAYNIRTYGVAATGSYYTCLRAMKGCPIPPPAVWEKIVRKTFGSKRGYLIARLIKLGEASYNTGDTFYTLSTSGYELFMQLQKSANRDPEQRSTDFWKAVWDFGIDSQSISKTQFIQLKTHWKSAQKHWKTNFPKKR